ncbi:TPA: phenolic acid decarboxylase [Escherichia coli]|nr:phenolic acid decarboxylase [Escherichia coli]
MSSFDRNDLSGLVGKHLVYTYDNGWNYEIYVKNATTLDYRIHSGIVANRWVKDQEVYIVRVGAEIFKISWTEPTGTDVSLIVNMVDKLFHGTIFFPRWVVNSPEKTICFQNEHVPQMVEYREAGPAYPTEVIDEFATITFIRDCGPDDDSIICCAANELPDDFPENLK